MPKRVLVLNGPNLNMLGIREPKTYGSQTLADIEAMCKAEGKKLGLTVDCRQTNREGELCEWIQEAYGKKDGIIINPGGRTGGLRAYLIYIDVVHNGEQPGTQVALRPPQMQFH